MDNKLFIEIVLLIGMSFAYPYILGESLFGEGTVSAMSLEDIKSITDFVSSDFNKIKVCPETKDGAVCQQMSLAVCDEQCVVSCVEPDDAECEIGTCYDAENGICDFNTGKKDCNGDWIADPNGNDVRCEKHCCLIGNDAFLMTERECEKTAEGMGMEQEFDTNVIFEWDCIPLGIRQEMGACVIDLSDEGKTCKFVTRDECVALTGDVSNFNPDKLCSSIDGIDCTAKNRTGCVDGLDEVYWFDSCGNRENIFGTDYSADVVMKENSCAIGDFENFLKNQATCGNCNRLFSSICGNETNGQELDDNPDGGVVCRDLGCDDDGKRRENGETWCAYQGAIWDGTMIGSALTYFTGFTIPNLFSTDPPGSNHFRKSCVDGEIQIEPCENYRNDICVESRTKNDETGKEFSVAACRPNRWQECLNYNSGDSGTLGPLTQVVGMLAQFIPMIGTVLQGSVQLEKVKIAQMMIKCSSDPDCYVGGVNVRNSKFNFPMCLPKYPPGLNLEEDTGQEKICGIASQTCATVWMKESIVGTMSLTAKWVCKANCGCATGSSPESAMPSQDFVQQMHNLCTALGDCGTKFNYKGGLGGVGTGYSVTKKSYSGLPKEDGSDKKGKPVLAFALPSLPSFGAIEGQYIPADAEALGRVLESGGSTGTGEGIDTGGIPSFTPYNPNKMMLITGLSAGALSLGVFGAAQAGWLGVAPALSPPIISVPISGNLPGVGLSGAPPGTASYLLTETSSGGYSVAGGGAPIAGGSAAEAGAPAALPGGMAEAEGFGGATGGSGSGSSGATASAIQAGAIGAGIGLAVVSLLVGISGIGAGVGQIGVITYMAAGAAAGLLIGIGFWGPKIAGLGPAGIAIGVYLVADIIANWIAGVGDIKTVEFHFECKPWTAPYGGSDCEKCMEDDFPCTKYSCEALGQTCRYDGNEPHAKCLDDSPSDVTPPKIISPTETISEEYEYFGVTDNGFIVKKINDECLTQFDSVTFGVKLSEYGRCRIGKPGSDFEEMLDFGENYLNTEQSYTFRPAQLENMGIDDIPIEDDTNVALSIICEDGKEQRSDAFPYTVNVCVHWLDLGAPLVNQVGPATLWTSYDSTTREITHYVAEQAECRWSLDDVKFEDMQNEMNCGSEKTENGYVCTAEVPVEVGENEYFRRCANHPEWVNTDREEQRNVNQQSWSVVVQKTEKPVEIVSVKPDGDIFTTGMPSYTIDVEVETSGGNADTTACWVGPGKIDLLNKISNGVFRKSYEDYAVRQASQEYSLTIECGDGINPDVTKTTTFTIKQDLISPEVTRVYIDGGRLNVVTNEAAKCAFVFGAEAGDMNACNFDFANAYDGDGTMSANANGMIHSVSLDETKTYYIKCEDNYGNGAGSRCNTIAKGSAF